MADDPAAMRRTPFFAPLLALLPACTLLVPVPPLFSSSQSVVQLDFEDAPLNQTPPQLEQLSKGRWAVADSPQAVSGNQVLVRRGESLSVLALREDAADVGGEVSMRMLLGESGAGLACETEDGNGFLLEVDPDRGQVVLSRRGGEERRVVARKSAKVTKGGWVKLGLRCGPERVVGYLDGESVVQHETPLGRARLALWADGGVTVQFDDLRYVLGRGD